MQPTATDLYRPDPLLDLVLERTVDLPPEKVWAAWTQPELLMRWFCPLPWSVSACEIDLRPGGVFKTTMRSPEGEEFPNTGCWLEVVPMRRLVFTDTLLPGFRPAPNPFMTGVIRLEPAGAGTHYTAMARHLDAGATERHAAMGFQEGWGKALDQLVALMS